jgi:hypothetical protein
LGDVTGRHKDDSEFCRTNTRGVDREEATLKGWAWIFIFCVALTGAVQHFWGKPAKWVLVAAVGVIIIVTQRYREKSYTRRSEEKRQWLIRMRSGGGGSC